MNTSRRDDTVSSPGPSIRIPDKGGTELGDNPHWSVGNMSALREIETSISQSQYPPPSFWYERKKTDNPWNRSKCLFNSSGSSTCRLSIRFCNVDLINSSRNLARSSRESTVPLTRFASESASSATVFACAAASIASLADCFASPASFWATINKASLWERKEVSTLDERSSNTPSPSTPIITSKRPTAPRGMTQEVEFSSSTGKFLLSRHHRFRSVHVSAISSMQPTATKPAEMRSQWNHFSLAASNDRRTVSTGGDEFANRRAKEMRWFLIFWLAPQNTPHKINPYNHLQLFSKIVPFT